ncbi:MAG: hypothetical protein PHW76_01440 [Alphaproteobacteria bacterium]|nr:hypothetical protein [Alphaproteobacteria bacterium]
MAPFFMPAPRDLSVFFSGSLLLIVVPFFSEGAGSLGFCGAISPMLAEVLAPGTKTFPANPAPESSNAVVKRPKTA